VSALSVREAYRRWAPEYERETAISALEDLTISELGIHTAGRALVDVGCGTARRLRETGAAQAIGVDASIEMLEQGSRSFALVAGDVRAIPLAAGQFDVVWCRLAIGHVRELAPAYRELARVCRIDGTVVVSDISPDAATSGHRRTFRDATGETYEVEHFVHSMDAHIAAASAAGLALVERRDGLCGPSVRHFYVEAGRTNAYDEQLGKALVLALSWRKVRVDQ
jgi:malonyl-CoA O-methyltransferase